MRHKVLISGGYGRSAIDPTGGEVNSKLHLYRDPDAPLEASTKRYVDTNAANIHSASISVGTFDVERLPAFSGDIVKIANSGTPTLTTSGVSAGTYTKVTVNIKGVVTFGTAMSPGDLPLLPWDKVINRPTNLSGYNIQDGLDKFNPTMTGPLKSYGVPVYDNDAVTVEYVEQLLGRTDKLGQVVYKSTPISPYGFLRCNGGVVSKSMYSDLYDLLGDGFKPVDEPEYPGSFYLPIIETGLFETYAYIRFIGDSQLPPTLR